MTRIRFKHKADAALFVVGQSMWSPDGGKTWNRGEPPKAPTDGPGFVVTKVDKQRGSITVGPASPRGPRLQGSTTWSGLEPNVELADTKTLLEHAVRLLRLHVGDHEMKPGCAWNNGEPCYNCRTVAFLRDNFDAANKPDPRPEAPPSPCMSCDKPASFFEGTTNRWCYEHVPPAYCGGRLQGRGE